MTKKRRNQIHINSNNSAHCDDFEQKFEMEKKCNFKTWKA